MADHAGQGEADPDTCQYNDLALVKLDPSRRRQGQPVDPALGRPERVGASTALRDKVYSYGNSELRGGITQLSPKEGYSLGDDAGGWTPPRLHGDPGHPG